MNAKKIICLLLALILPAAAPVRVFAETRNIYVGDIISLEISSRDYSTDFLREKFHLPRRDCKF